MENPFAGMDTDTMLRTLKQEAEQIESKALQLRADLADATTTVSSPDGAVTVTVSPTGALQNISFSDKATNHRPETLGPLVMKTVQAAQRQISEHFTKSVSRQFGDTDTMEFVRQYLPQPEANPPRSTETDLDEDRGSIMRKRQGRRA